MKDEGDDQGRAEHVDWGAAGSVAAVPLVEEGRTRVEDEDRGEAGASGVGGGPRYRIVRAYSGGGLGVVSVAVDRELDRAVALKEIREAEADAAGSRARFVREAEITAKLEHPGIVPVYGHGRHVDGRPYYAMRLIRGESLKDAIARFHLRPGEAAVDGKKGPEDRERTAEGSGPVSGTLVAARSRAGHQEFRSLAFRDLIGRFVAVCETIEYAHSRKVLHRDLKPTNIMLGPFGETLVVDWGLAKVMSEGAGSASGEAELGDGSGPVRLSDSSGATGEKEGAAIGTPQYMSPEQAKGEVGHLGPATDVYGLGATLYAILTMRAPVEGEDLAAVRERVIRGDVPTPRSVVAAAPRALEAICRKAMSLRAEERYATARLLGDELRRWLADEPVTVLEEGGFERLGRWGRRHRSAAAAGVASLAVVAVVSLIAAGLVGEALEVAQGATARETEATNQARKNFRNAMDQLHRFPQLVAEFSDLHGDDPKLRELRTKLLRAAVEYDREFVEGHEQDDLFADELTTAYGRLAELTAELDDPGAALGLYQRAGDRLDRAIAERVGGPQRELIRRRVTLARGQGEALRRLGRRREAESAYRSAIGRVKSLLARAGAREADNDADRYALVRLYHDLALAVDAPNRMDEYRKLNEQARAILDQLMKADATDPRYRYDLALSEHRRALDADERGDEAEAFAAIERAIGLVDGLVRERPDSMPDRYVAAFFRHNFAALCARRGRADEALVRFGEATDGLRKVVGQAPDDIEYVNQLAYCLYRYGRFLRRIDREADGEWLLGESAEAYDTLLSRHPDLSEAQDEQVSAWIALGAARMAAGRLEQAEEALTRARACNDDFRRRYPDRESGEYDLAQCLGVWGRLLVKLGAERLEEAEETAREEIAVRARLHDRHAGGADDAAWLAEAHERLGRLLMDRGDAAGAAACFGRAVDGMAEAVGLEPGRADLRRQLDDLRRRLDEATVAADR